MVRIRLARRGRKNLALYDVVVADARAPRDGRFIEKIGTYNPNTDPAQVNIDEEKAFQWLMNGAQPTDTVRAMLSYRGVLMRKHLQVGVTKGALTQEQADEKLEAWKKEKAAKIQVKIDRLTAESEKKAQDKLAAEAKVKEARAEAIRKKQAAIEEEIKAAEAAASSESEAAADAEEGQTSEAEKIPAAEESKTSEPAIETPAEPEAVQTEPEPAEEPKAEEPGVESTPAAETSSEAKEEAQSPEPEQTGEESKTEEATDSEPEARKEE